MFLLIFESIGTSELILICVVALIFLGPRKLPQIAKTIGKTMSEFRNATNEFKQTWEREVNFEEETNALRTGDIPGSPPAPVARENSILNPEVPETLAAPEIKQIDKESFEALAEKLADAPQPADAPSDKRSWL
ncbi:MAG TPA: Sec-independent protein translocase protein TatB [Pyrinomonadaceae bacterium]|nr:Sec-independent protein translocase protein TatB [Pyrinomonadaceae bacterium]